VTEATNPVAVDLGGHWTLTDANGDYACTLNLQGDGITALHDAGLIPDPYWGRNEYDLRWISERDWIATRTFDHDGSEADLIIDGLDCVAEIRLNGHSLTQKANAFRRWRIRTWNWLVAGRNTIEIHFKSPVRVAAEQQEAQPFFVPYIAQNNPIPNGNMLRKPACDWGWDWNIALAPFGVTGSILIEPVGPRIDDIIVTQTHYYDRIDVALKVRTHGLPDGAIVTATMCGVTTTAPVYRNHAHPTVSVQGAALWWPAGMGAQVLHDLTVSSSDVTSTRRIGLRQLSLVTEKDAAGLSFGFRVNGRDVFAKGANWIPTDALPGRITAEKTRDLLQSAVDANMNMIRVWGGGRYEPDSFYDACDELGLMVWQDLMFSCNLYPSTPEFLEEVDAEVRENVARIHHHACIALWCGDNELIGALTWFPESRKDRDRYLVNYDRLNRTIETALKATHYEANWWPSSPSPGPMSFGDAWHDDGSGDMHFWSVWHEGRDFDHYRDVSPRFCSEFGFQSYPSMDVIAKFAGPEDWNIAAPVLESHQKNKGGNARIAETMFRYFRWPSKFEDFVYLSQVQQGLAIKTAVTHWRSLKPHCMGALIWQLNDTWPCCSWASLDHGGGWKLLHHMAKDFFAPVFVSAVPDGEELVLRAINDTLDAIDLTVRVLAVNMAGETRTLGEAVVAVGTSAVEAIRVAKSALKDDEMLAYTWAGSDGAKGGDVFSPKPFKAYDLAPSQLAHDVTGADGVWTITVSAKALALFVSLEASVPGRFSDNAFSLFPGYPATITFTPQNRGDAPTFTLRDLYSATTA
jgi:beta-mannosidase